MESLPTNISLIETPSLSKHQRGQRRGFYGALWRYNVDTNPITSQNIHTAHGSLTDYTITTYPHITKEEFRRNLDNLQKTTQVISKKFKQSPLPEHGWQIENYNYFTFICE